MSTYEKIGEVLSDQEFYTANAKLEKHEEIIKAVQERVPEATESEVDAFLTEVSDVLLSKAEEPTGELTEDDLENVSGGIVITLAVIGAVVKCVGLAITAGGIIGGAIWYWKNRKNL